MEVEGNKNGKLNNFSVDKYQHQHCSTDLQSPSSPKLTPASTLSLSIPSFTSCIDSSRPAATVVSSVSEEDVYAFLLGHCLRTGNNEKFLEIYDSLPKCYSRDLVDKVKEKARNISDLSDDEFAKLSQLSGRSRPDNKDIYISPSMSEEDGGCGSSEYGGLLFANQSTKPIAVINGSVSFGLNDVDIEALDNGTDLVAITNLPDNNSSLKDSLSMKSQLPATEIAPKSKTNQSSGVVPAVVNNNNKKNFNNNDVVSHLSSKNLHKNNTNNSMEEIVAKSGEKHMGRNCGVDASSLNINSTATNTPCQNLGAATARVFQNRTGSQSSSQYDEYLSCDGDDKHEQPLDEDETSVGAGETAATPTTTNHLLNEVGSKTRKKKKKNKVKRQNNASSNTTGSNTSNGTVEQCNDSVSPATRTLEVEIDPRIEMTVPVSCSRNVSNSMMSSAGRNNDIDNIRSINCDYSIINSEKAPKSSFLDSVSSRSEGSVTCSSPSSLYISPIANTDIVNCDCGGDTNNQRLDDCSTNMCDVVRQSDNTIATISTGPPFLPPTAEAANKDTVVVVDDADASYSYTPSSLTPTTDVNINGAAFQSNNDVGEIMTSLRECNGRILQESLTIDVENFEEDFQEVKRKSRNGGKNASVGTGDSFNSNVVLGGLGVQSDNGHLNYRKGVPYSNNNSTFVPNNQTAGAPYLSNDSKFINTSKNPYVPSSYRHSHKNASYQLTAAMSPSSSPVQTSSGAIRSSSSSTSNSVASSSSLSVQHLLLPSHDGANTNNELNSNSHSYANKLKTSLHSNSSATSKSQHINNTPATHFKPNTKSPLSNSNDPKYFAPNLMNSKCNLSLPSTMSPSQSRLASPKTSSSIASHHNKHTNSRSPNSKTQNQVQTAANSRNHLNEYSPNSKSVNSSSLNSTLKNDISPNSGLLPSNRTSPKSANGKRGDVVNSNYSGKNHSRRPLTNQNAHFISPKSSKSAINANDAPMIVPSSQNNSRRPPQTNLKALNKNDEEVIHGVVSARAINDPNFVMKNGGKIFVSLPCDGKESNENVTSSSSKQLSFQYEVDINCNPVGTDHHYLTNYAEPPTQPQTNLSCRHQSKHDDAKQSPHSSQLPTQSSSSFSPNETTSPEAKCEDLRHEKHNHNQNGIDLNEVSSVFESSAVSSDLSGCRGNEDSSYVSSNSFQLPKLTNELSNDLKTERKTHEPQSQSLATSVRSGSGVLGKLQFGDFDINSIDGAAVGDFNLFEATALLATSWESWLCRETNDKEWFNYLASSPSPSQEFNYPEAVTSDLASSQMSSENQAEQLAKNNSSNDIKK